MKLDTTKDKLKRVNNMPSFIKSKNIYKEGRRRYNHT